MLILAFVALTLLYGRKRKNISFFILLKREGWNFNGQKLPSIFQMNSVKSLQWISKIREWKH